MRIALSLLLVLLTVAETSHADTRLQIETDPSTFVLHGFSAHVRVANDRAPRWIASIGAYRLDLPSAFVDVNPKNRGDDWDVRLRVGYGVFLDRYLAHPDRGAFVGFQLAVQHFRASAPEPAMTKRFVNGLAMPRIGYTWFPFDRRFYVLGWLGVGATATIGGDPGAYDVFPVIAFAAVHVGWSFGGTP